MNKLITKTPIAFIEGDGIGPEITNSYQSVVDVAVELAYGGTRKIDRQEVYASEKAMKLLGTYLPEETVRTLEDLGLGIKGPMNTPKGGGHRSLNVALRKRLDLYVCERPIRYYEGAPSPLANPRGIDLTIFRENTEDIYKGIEFRAGSRKAKVVAGLIKILGGDIDWKSGVGIKPITQRATQRIMKAAMDRALEYGKQRVTIAHKGNIMKFTEGAFEKWGFDVAQQQYPEAIINPNGTLKYWETPEGRVFVDSLIADNMFAQLIKRPQQFNYIVAPNLNGDFLSDAAAELVGGLGISAGINVNYENGRIVAEATHGTAPDIQGQNKANSLSIILSACMLLKHMGWHEAADLVEEAVKMQLQQGRVTGDFMAAFPGHLKKEKILLTTTSQRDDLIQIMQDL